MSALTTPISERRARFNRLRWWWQQRLGWVGGLALLLLLGAALLPTVLRPAIRQAQADLLRDHVAQLDRLARQRGSPASPQRDIRDARDVLLDSLPPVSQRGESVALLLTLLEQAQVGADSADYLAEEQPPGLIRLRVNLPMRGSYPAMRRLVATLLNRLPHAALDGMELERSTEAGVGAALTGQLRLSLYFRKLAP